MDETYQDYLNRVAKLTRSASYHTQLHNLQPSPKFKEGKAVAFPGYTVNSPTWAQDDYPANQAFYQHLQTLQEQLLGEINTEMIIPVPPQSFHLTITDLIWEDTYRDAVARDENFDEKLRDRIASSFQQYEQQHQTPHPVQLQILGFTLRPRTLSVALLPKSEEAYQKLLHLRRAIYQNSDLIALGVEQQYPYTAHITLGYFGSIPENLDRDRIAKTLDRLNDAELDRDPELLTLQQAELHKFSDMTHYYREANFPVVKL